MATSKEYLALISEQLSELDDITHKQMMGEYIIYYHKKIASYLCDNKLFVKPVSSVFKLIPDAKMESPYDGAKEMILVENVDDRNFLTMLFESIYDELPELRKKK